MTKISKHVVDKRGVKKSQHQANYSIVYTYPGRLANIRLSLTLYKPVDMFASKLANFRIATTVYCARVPEQASYL